MPRGFKPKPDADRLKNRVVTRFNDEDFKDLINILRESEQYSTIGELTREMIQYYIKKYRQANFKQMRIE